MSLWIPIALATILAIALVVRPLVRAHPPVADGSQDDERRLAVFRDRKREIERERAAGRLSEKEAAQAQDDLVRQLAEDLPPETPARTPGAAAGVWIAAGMASVATSVATPGSTPGSASHTNTASTAPGHRALLAAIAVAVLIPLVAVGVYRQVGAPQLALAGHVDENASIGPAQIEAMIARVEERTRVDPQDGQAWAMLARARKVQGRLAESVAAYAHAVERIPDDARLLTDYAEASALLAGGDFRGPPTALLERALTVDPREPKAIALMGAAQYRAGNLAQARSLLVRLEEFLTPGSDEAQQIGAIVRQIDGEISAAGTKAENAGKMRSKAVESKTVESKTAGSQTDDTGVGAAADAAVPAAPGDSARDH